MKKIFLALTVMLFSLTSINTFAQTRHRPHPVKHYKKHPHRVHHSKNYYYKKKLAMKRAHERRLAHARRVHGLPHHP